MASRGINKVIIVGNLGNEPEVRQTTGGSCVTNISLATSETWKDNKLAEIAGQYLHKGAKVYIEGTLRTEKWTDTNGQERYTTKIISNEMQMLDKKGDMPDNQFGKAPGVSQPPANPQPKSPNQAAADAWDDDLPF